VPNKLGGVVALVISIAVLFFLPLFSSQVVGGVVFSPLRRFFF